MTIDLNNMDVTVLPNFKGGEKAFAANMFFDGTNRIFKGRLVPGATIGMHTHEDSCEVIFVLEGKGPRHLPAHLPDTRQLSRATPACSSS